MNKYSRPLNSAANARIRTAAIPNASSPREHPAERMPSQRCATKGVAAAPGMGSGDSASDVRILSEDDR